MSERVRPYVVLRRGRLDLHHVLPARRGQDRVPGRCGLHVEVVPHARARARADGRRHRLLPARPRGLHQAAGDAAHLQHQDAVGLPVRLRLVSGSPAAFVRDDHRNHGSLQSHLSDLLRREQSRAFALPVGRTGAADDRCGRAQRRPARHRAVVGRRAHHASGLPRDPRPRQGGAHPARDGEHQRHPDCHRRGLRERTRRSLGALRGLSPVRLVRARGADGAARRRPARHPPPRPRPAERARHRHHARGHAQEGPERPRDRQDHRLRARAAGGARGHSAADSSRGPARALQSRRPTG